jgi:cytoskeletal protein RodZ
MEINKMSELTFENKNENKRGWLLPLMFVVLVTAVAIAALALSGVFSTTATTENSPETPQGLWESQGIESYQYTLQVGCFCMTDMTQPVIIEVQNGEVASITYAADGSAANPELFERYNSIDKLFTVIDEAEAQDPALLDVTYDETYGVPLSVNIDISEMMADEELYLTISDFQTVQ